MSDLAETVARAICFAECQDNKVHCPFPEACCEWEPELDAAHAAIAAIPGADAIQRLTEELAERVEHLADAEALITQHYDRAIAAEAARDEARAALARIESWEPATQDVTLAHQMAAEARAALPENWSLPPQPVTDIQRIVGEHADALRRLADK